MNARKGLIEYLEITEEALGIGHLDGKPVKGWEGHKDVQKKPLSTADSAGASEVTGCTQQRVADIVVKAKTSSPSDLSRLIKENGVDFPEHRGEIVVYADINDFRQMQELEANHPGKILDSICKVKVVADSVSGDLMLMFDTGNADTDRFRAYKNPIYGIGLVYYDAGFTTTTISVRHGDDRNKQLYNFNIEITSHEQDGKPFNRISCTCKENGESLNIYTDKQKNSNRDYARYLETMNSSEEKEGVFNAFIEMLEYGFFNSDFDRMFGNKGK